MSISAPRDCAGSIRPRKKVGSTHVSPGAKYKRVTSDRASDSQSIRRGIAIPDEVPGEDLFNDEAYYVLNREEVLRGKGVYA